MFKEKIAVITGASSGIGLAIAKEFKKSEMLVAVIDIKDCNEKFDLFFKGDISIESDLTAFTNKAISKFGRIDFLINNACISKRGILSDCSFDDFLYVQKVGVVAPYILTKKFLPYFNNGGAVVNISSSRAFQSQPDTESYSAAKGGIISLTHSMAVSLSGKVRVNCISPGWINTNNDVFSDADYIQHPSGRIGKSEDIANMVMYLCSDKAEFINGQNIIIDGGMSKQMIYHGDHNWILNLDK